METILSTIRSEVESDTVLANNKHSDKNKEDAPNGHHADDATNPAPINGQHSVENEAEDHAPLDLSVADIIDEQPSADNNQAADAIELEPDVTAVPVTTPEETVDLEAFAQPPAANEKSDSVSELADVMVQQENQNQQANEYLEGVGDVAEAEAEIDKLLAEVQAEDEKKNAQKDQLENLEPSTAESSPDASAAEPNESEDGSEIQPVDEAPADDVERTDIDALLQSTDNTTEDMEHTPTEPEEMDPEAAKAELLEQADLTPEQAEALGVPEQAAAPTPDEQETEYEAEPDNQLLTEEPVVPTEQEDATEEVTEKAAEKAAEEVTEEANESSETETKPAAAPEKPQERLQLHAIPSATGLQVAFPAEVLAEALRPLVRDWVEENLPDLVERLVREELSKLANR